MNKKDALAIGLHIAGLVFPQVGTIEAIAKSIPGLKGQSKEDAAIHLTMESVTLFEDLISKDVVNDPEVEKAIRGVIQAVVALQNVLVKHEQPVS